jgi:hypothetical protein
MSQRGIPAKTALPLKLITQKMAMDMPPGMN